MLVFRDLAAASLGYGCNSRLERVVWLLPPGFPSAHLTLPNDDGGCPLAQPLVLLIQARLCQRAMPDEVRRDTIKHYKRLCASCGCHDVQQLSAHLAEERSPRRCQIARRLRACDQLSVEELLPVCVSIGKTEQEISWQGLLAYLHRLTLATGADGHLKSDMACFAAAWSAIR